jgi:hypothetical protein
MGLFLKSYLPSYFVKKGENRALKEDTGEITGIDESVRSAITEIGTGRDAYLREQKACLLKYYDLLIDFYYEKLGVDFGDFPMDNLQSLAAFQKSFYENISEIIKSYQRIVLYFDDETPVRIHAEESLDQVLNARNVMKKHFGPLKLRAWDEDQAFKSGEEDKYREALVEAVKADRECWDAMLPITKELTVALRSYLTALNKFLRPHELPNIPKGLLKDK